MSGQDYEQLTLFQADSPASHSVLPGSEEAGMMTVSSGLKCLELYKKSGPLGSLVRMLLGSSQWRSTRCYLTWKPSATPSKRLFFRLVPSTPRTGGIDARLWPTPTAGQCGMTATTSGRPLEKSTHLSAQVYLAEQTKLWPTATARCSTGASQTATRQGGPDLQTSVGGQLNPTWVEWLMGFPLGWTDLQASETP